MTKNENEKKKETASDCLGLWWRAKRSENETCRSGFVCIDRFIFNFLFRFRCLIHSQLFFHIVSLLSQNRHLSTYPPIIKMKLENGSKIT